METISLCWILDGVLSIIQWKRREINPKRLLPILISNGKLSRIFLEEFLRLLKHSPHNTKMSLLKFKSNISKNIDIYMITIGLSWMPYGVLSIIRWKRREINPKILLSIHVSNGQISRMFSKEC